MLNGCSRTFCVVVFHHGRGRSGILVNPQDAAWLGLGLGLGPESSAMASSIPPATLFISLPLVEIRFRRRCAAALRFGGMVVVGSGGAYAHAASHTFHRLCSFSRQRDAHWNREGGHTEPAQHCATIDATMTVVLLFLVRCGQVQH